MNYFNYFTEIEDTFIRRRGKHLLLSSMDWALIESWKETGVPLFVALRGIERAFDSFEAKPRRRSVKTLLYCQEEVEAQYAEWLESQVGAGASDTNGDARPGNDAESDALLPFPRAVILDHLNHASAELERLLDERKRINEDEFCDTLARTIARLEDLRQDFVVAVRPNAEALENSLTSLELMLDKVLLESISADELSTARAEIEMQLGSYRTRMDAAMYQQTCDNLLLKRLREQNSIPRLSLFYL